MSEKSKKPPPDPLMELCGHSPVTGLTFSDSADNDDEIVFSGHQNGKILEWNLKTQRPLSTIDAHNSESVIWLHDLRTSIPEKTDIDKEIPLCILVSQGRDGFVRFWKRRILDSAIKWEQTEQVTCAPLTFCNSAITIFDKIFMLSVPHEDTGKIALFSSPTDALQASANSNNSHSVFLPTNHRSCVPPSRKNFGMCMRTRSFLYKSNPLLLVGYESGTMAVWDLFKVEIISQVSAHNESIMCLDVWVSQGSSDIGAKCEIISGSVDNELKSWQISSAECCENKLLLEPGFSIYVTNSGFADVAIRSDGKLIVTGGWDGISRVFTTKKLRQLAVLSSHKQTVQCVAFSTNKLVAIASKDGYITVWDVYKES